MVWSAAILLVALATGDVNAQATHEYEMQNCSINLEANENHHVQDPTDCRVFFNCDGANRGTRTSCPEGTVYDAEAGICNTDGDCQTWNQLADCARNPTGARNFSAQCCHTYFHYDCSTQSFKFQYCGVTQWFKDGRCGSDKPTSGCVFCNSSVIGDRCDVTGLEYTGPCTFRMRGSMWEMRCAEGTAMDRTQCTCVRDDDKVCNRIQGCQTKHTLDFSTRRFDTEPHAHVAGWQDLERSGMPDHVFPLTYLHGQDFGYLPVALLLRFTLHPQHRATNVAILTADPDEDGFNVETRVLNLSTVRVRVANQNESMTLQGNLPFTPEVYTVRLIFDVKDRLFLAQANDVNLTSVVGDMDHTLMLNRWSAKKLPGVADLWLDTYYGRILEMSYWRNCVNFAQMN